MWAHQTASPGQQYPQNHRQSTISDTQSVSSYHSVNTPTMTGQPNLPYQQKYSPAPHQQQTSNPPPLTSVLLSSSPHHYQAATQHPFLRLAGLGQLPKETLSRWLSQDRLYAQAYVGFIGSLLARVDLPHVFVHDKSTSLRWRIVKMLTSCLTNIHREIDFFTTTAQKYDLDLEAPARSRDAHFTAEPATKQYIDLFRAFLTDPSMSLLEGLVVLWATETVYLKAWSYAASYIHAPYTSEHSSPHVRPTLPFSRPNSHYTYNIPPAPNSNYAPSQADSEGPIPIMNAEDLPRANHGATRTPSFRSATSTSTNTAGNNNRTNSPDLDGGALRNEFIPNWTSPEFVAFVDEIADLTNDLAAREESLFRKLDVYEGVWRYILDIETRFWPNVG